MTTQHMLVPLDWSAYAEHALAYAIDLARPLGARLTLLHVMEPQSQEWEAEVPPRMEAYLAQAKAAGRQGRIAIVYGVACDELLALASAQQVDLIVMGTHGRTGLTHALLGSVAERVVRLAPCPVLVVRPVAAAAEAA